MRRSILLLLIAVMGCGLFDLGPGDPLTVLLRNRDRWNALGITDYNFEYQLGGCECLPSSTARVIISVKDGQVVNVASPIYEIDFATDSWPTIDSIFARTERDMRQGYKVEITYDGTYHFPGLVSADYPVTVDDEYTITATKLSPVPK